MVIEIYKDEYCKNYVGKVINGDVEDMIDFLRKKIKRNKCDVFTYCWDEDGACAMSDDEECAVERDSEAMLSLISNRVSKFGYCRFGCKLGEVVVKDPLNVDYIKRVIAEKQKILSLLQEKQK